MNMAAIFKTRVALLILTVYFNHVLLLSLPKRTYHTLPGTDDDIEEIAQLKKHAKPPVTTHTTSFIYQIPDQVNGQTQQQAQQNDQGDKAPAIREVADKQPDSILMPSEVASTADSSDQQQLPAQVIKVLRPNQRQIIKVLQPGQQQMIKTIQPGQTIMMVQPMAAGSKTPVPLDIDHVNGYIGQLANKQWGPYQVTIGPFTLYPLYEKALGAMKYVFAHMPPMSKVIRDTLSMAETLKSYVPLGNYLANTAQQVMPVQVQQQQQGGYQRMYQVQAPHYQQVSLQPMPLQQPQVPQDQLG